MPNSGDLRRRTAVAGINSNCAAAYGHRPRKGKLQSVKGAGMLAIIPILGQVVAVIDGRIQATAFNAVQALTKDMVPVNVDAA